jgi:nucleoside phosphorylase
MRIFDRMPLLAGALSAVALILGAGATRAADSSTAQQAATAAPTPSATPRPSACTGDCNDDGVVELDELVRGVGAALGTADAEQCRAFRMTTDGAVAIGELVQAVQRALRGCDSAPPFVAVLSAFPAELAAVLERATVDEGVVLGDRVMRVGELGGVRVVMGMTGIGIANATATTAAVLDRFPVTGVVVSGVAGSTLNIGDVTVPNSWMLDDSATYAAYPPWLALANQTTAPGLVDLQSCIVVPDHGEAPVCLPNAPAVVVGGIGHSSGFENSPVPCTPGGGDVFGCDAVPASSGSGSAVSMERAAVLDEPTTPVAEDMETAAIAAQAQMRGLPFIGFRAVSDGAGDPLMLPGFPSQFAAYYPLSAHNAAAAATAFLQELAQSRAVPASSR